MGRQIQRSNKVKLFLRLATELNDNLRTLLRYRGDLSHFIEEALNKTDLTNVKLFTGIATGNAGGTTATIKIRTGLRLKAAAKARGCSMDILANSAILAWLGVNRSPSANKKVHLP